MSLTICKECGASISDTAQFCPQCGAALYPYRTIVRDYVKSPVSESRHPDTYMAHAIFLGIASFLLFSIWCLPFAIACFVYANKVDSLWERGDIDGAYLASAKARHLYHIGLWVGIIPIIIAIIVITLIILYSL